MNILITGGAGFIGTHVVSRFVMQYPNYNIVNLDALTYAGNLENLKTVQDHKNYTFIKGDITDSDLVKQLFKKYHFQAVIHLAAESHVDRSIETPLAFAQTNIIGTMTLLNAFRDTHKTSFKDTLFYQISTDEVYGSLGSRGLFSETSPYSPNSPYAASKASADHFVRAYGETYGVPYIISNCSNNYGEYQFPEKLIPRFINNIVNNQPLPVYGNGHYTRDWLYVGDHARAIDLIFHQGNQGDSYTIGGFNEWKNIDLVRLLCQKMDVKLKRPKGHSETLITYVNDRPGHDLRYAIDASKIKNDLGWTPSVTFEEGLNMTIDWYLEHQTWLDNITTGHYRNHQK